LFDKKHVLDRLGELDIFKVSLRPEEAGDKYVGYRAIPILDKIVFIGSKRRLARFTHIY